MPITTAICIKAFLNVGFTIDINPISASGAPMQAGTIAGAAFLKEFVNDDIPWVHFDIAGTAWGVDPSSIHPKGSATGWGIRLVLDMMDVK